MSGMTVGNQSQIAHDLSIAITKSNNHKEVEGAAVNLSPNERSFTELNNLMKNIEKTLHISPEHLDKLSEHLEHLKNSLRQATELLPTMNSVSNKAKALDKKIPVPKEILDFMEDNHINVNGNNIDDFIVGSANGFKSISANKSQSNTTPRTTNTAITLTDPQDDKMDIFNYKGNYSTYGEKGYTQVKPTIQGDKISFTQNGKTYTGIIPTRLLAKTATLNHSQHSSIEKALSSYIDNQESSIKQHTKKAESLLTSLKNTASVMGGFPDIKDLDQVEKMLNF